MPVSVTTRTANGAPLTTVQMDTNWTNLKTAIDTVEAAQAAPAVAIADGTVSTAAKLGAGVVTTPAILDANVTMNKLAQEVKDAITAAGSFSSRKFFAADTTVSQNYSAGSTQVKVNFTHEVADTDDRFDAANGKFLVDASGWYQMVVQLRIDTLSFTGTPVLSHQVKVLANGSELRAQSETNGAELIGSTYALFQAVQADAGDYLEVFYECTVTGGTAELQITSDADKTVFQGYRVG